MNSRPLTPDEQQAASRERVSEIVWKLKLFTLEELVDLKNQLGQEAPELLEEIQS